LSQKCLFTIIVTYFCYITYARLLAEKSEEDSRNKNVLCYLDHRYLMYQGIQP